MEFISLTVTVRVGNLEIVRHVNKEDVLIGRPQTGER